MPRPVRTLPAVLLPFLLLALTAPALAGDKPLTLERIFSDPPLAGRTAEGVAWSPDGSRLALLERSGDEKTPSFALVAVDPATGARSTLLAEKDLPSFGAGDKAVRPALQGYRWLPDGRGLLLQGGGDLFVYELESRSTRRLTETAGAEEELQFSPDGRFLGFVRERDLYALELASGREIRLSTDGGENRYNAQWDWLYGEELTNPGTLAYAWSPDSRAIAYISLDETAVPRFPLVDEMSVQPAITLTPYPKPGDPNPVPSLRVVSVVPEPDGTRLAHDLAWPSGDSYLVRVGWLPDGKAAWYQVLNRAQTRLQLTRLDRATGLSSPVLVETDAAWINLHDDLRFLKDGRFLWSSERDGNRHLFLHDAAGKPVRQLTRGPWNVTAVVGFDEAAGTVFFLGKEKGPLELHLYRVQLDGGGLRRLTEERGTHFITGMSPNARWAVDSFSSALVPPSSYLIDAAGRRTATLADNTKAPWSEYAVGTQEFLALKAQDGTTLHASLLRPDGFDPAKKYPVIVYLYGGPGPQVVSDAWGRSYTMFHSYMASRGFLVFSIDNRGTGGRGRDFERVLLKRFGKIELEDQLAGVAYLKSLPFVDGERLGIWGWSYGGYMAAFALTNTPGTFRAGAAVAPVTNWLLYDSAYTERYLKLPAENPDGYRDSSPVNQAEKLAGALLLIHGTGDDNVHAQNTLQLAEKLYGAGKPYDLQLYPNKNHGIPGNPARLHLHRRIADHFERHLRAGQQPEPAAVPRPPG
jgi:dipeptidyl-peptidase-4